MPRESGPHGIGAHYARFVIGEEQLSTGSQVKRGAAADRAYDLHSRPLAVRTLDIDDLVALPQRKVDGLTGSPMQLAHRLQGCFAHGKTRLDQVAQFEQ